MEIISCSFQQITDMKAGRQGFEEDDDVFYAELKRQILLLTEEDDGDEACPGTTARRRKEPSRLTNKSCSKLQTGSHFHSWGSQKDTSVPSWLVNVWRTGNGTGVFIPQAVKNTRHAGRGTGRMNNQKRRVYKPEQRRQP